MLVSLLLAVLLTTPAFSQQAPVPTPADTPASAALDQEVLPELERRQESALARIDARAAWFRGERAAVGSAFVHLSGAPLNDPAFLRARRLALRQADRQRAVEGMSEPSADWSEKQTTRWLTARDRALELEASADALEARLLGRLEAAWEKAPQLAVPFSTAERERLAAGLRAAEEAGEDATAWATALGRHAELIRAAVHTSTISGDRSLHSLVLADLQEVAATQAAGTPPPLGAHHRLQAAHSLVPDLPGMDEVLLRVRQDELQAELARLRASQQPSLPSDPEALAALLVELDAQLSAPMVTEEVPDILEPIAAELARARRQSLETRRERVVQALESPEAATSTQADVENARERARSAQERADEAADDDDGAAAKLNTQIATFAAEELGQREADVAAQEAAAEEIDALQERQGKISALHVEALGMGVLAPERQRGFDQAYTDALRLVTDVRALVAERRRNMVEVATASATRYSQLPPESAVQGVPEPTRTEWLDARQGLIDALEARVQSTGQALDEALLLLKRVKEVRRQVRVDASGSARAQDSRDFLAQAYAEITEWPLLVASTFRQLWASRAQLPQRLLDLSTWWMLFTRSTELLLLGLAWLITRGRLESWWVLGLRALEGARYDREDTTLRRVVEWLDRVTTNGDWRHLSGPLGRISRYLADALLGGAILWVFGQSVPTIGLLALIWQLRALYLAGPELVLLVFNASAAPAPALVNTTVEIRSRAASTARWALLWWSIDRTSRYFTLHVMDADRVHAIIATISVLAGVALALYALFVWSAEVRQAVAKAEQDNLTRVLARPAPSPLLAAPLAAAGLAWLGSRWVVRAVTTLVEQRAGLAWLGSLLARQRLKIADTLPHARLPRTARAAIRSSQGPMEFPEALDALANHHSEVVAGRSHGLVAVISDPGFSDGRLLRQFDDMLDEDVKVIEVQPATHDVPQALSWFREVMEVAHVGELDTETLIAALLAQDPKVVFFRHTEHLFLRAVGGYTALREVLRVLHATSSHHRWVVEFHGPTWDLLHRVRSAVDLDVFATTVRLKPVPATRLSEWLLHLTRSAGYEVTFRHLVADGVLGSDTEKALERSEAAWWRLLADATAGNPGAALEAWLDSLREEEVGKLAVALLELPRSTDIDVFADRELFVLTALVVHRGMTVQELARSLNMPLGGCRSACRTLQGHGVLDELEGHRWRVRIAWFPAVVQHLRNKHFLHVR